jgi:DNA modification methylase
MFEELDQLGFPTYHTPNGVIIQADSMQLLEHLPYTFDLIILDPPWFDSDREEADDPLLKHWKLPNPRKLVSRVRMRLKKSGVVFIFGYQPYLIEYHKAFSDYGFRFMFELIWSKVERPAMGDGRYPLKAHANIWAYRLADTPLKDTHFNIKRACKNPEGEADRRTKPTAQIQPSRLKADGVIEYKVGVGYPRSVIEAGVVKEHHPEYVGHASQIPTSLIELIVKMGCEEGDLVLDPFLGSGTTGVVCERLNRKWVGIEITEEWCKKSYERILKDKVEQPAIKGLEEWF